jgi:hypothetical protein
MPVTVYRSSDASAPVMTGQAGTLVGVLDAVLVNGYGSKAAAGWTKPFSGTSKAAYRMGAGNQFYLRVQDDGSGAASFREARIVGYESMSGVDTGTNPFPTVAQFANGLFVRKSLALDAAARNWLCIADNRTFYLFITSGDPGGTTYFGWGFGDFYSNLALDGYRTFIHGRVIENSAGTGTDFSNCATSLVAATITGCYVARNRNAAVGALQVTKVSPGMAYTNVAASGNSSLLTFPNIENGGLYLGPILLGDKTTVPTSSLRGRFRGLWYLCHAHGNFVDGDTIAGVGDFAGRTLMVVRILADPSAVLGAVVVEISDTWDTSS